MNKHVEAVCVGKPLGLPEYDEDAELWSVYFEESETPWSPIEEPRDVIGVICDSAEEACDVYNFYNANPITEDNTNEEDN